MKKKVRTHNLLPAIGSATSIIGLAVAVVTILEISPALLISMGSVVVSFLAGVYSKDLAKSVRKLSRVRRLFLSYSSHSEDIANELSLLLRNKGAKVWTARERVKAGQSFEQAIRQAIDDADAFIVFLGKDLSPNVNYELGLAQAKHKKIVPILLESGQVPNDLRGIMYVDLGLDKNKAFDDVIKAVI
jgi:hypothetical protein